MQIRIALAIVLLDVSLFAQAPTPQQPLVSSSVNNFCRLDSDGRRLDAPGAKDFDKTLLAVETRWEQPAEIVIVSDCSVRMPLPKDFSVMVDYHVLARMDSSLFLTRLQTPYAGRSLTESERFSLILTGTHSEIGPDGRQVQVKGPLEWRIKSYPLEPHVGIQAAIAYVRRMEYRARDPRARMNAERTLSELQEMLALSAASHQISGPDTIAAQFVEMQMGGLGLESETAGQLNMFLVNPEAQNHQIVRVAKAYAVKKTVIAVNKATVSVDFGTLGELDSQLRFKNLDERGAIVQQDYKLLLDNKYHVDAIGDHPASEFVGPSRWRIEETPAVQ